MERSFFHFQMLLVSLYGAMVLTAWGQANGEPQVLPALCNSRVTIVVHRLSIWPLRACLVVLLIVLLCACLLLSPPLT